MHPAYSITDPKSATARVAQVGPLTITAQQFLLSYELGPSFPKREKESKRRYLEFMINEKLLALDGYARGLQRSDRTRASLEEIEGDLATEELYKDDVLRRVKVTEKELAGAVRGERVHRVLHWLFGPASNEIRQKAAELHEGIPFDTLFRGQVRDSVSLDNRSMETTLFRLHLNNPEIARIVDTLRPHLPSAPVKGPDGWYIFCIVDGWSDVISTESGYAKLRSDAKEALTQHKADSLSDRYVRRLMLDRDPVIIRRTFDRLRAWLGSRWLPPGKFSSWRLTEPFAGEADSLDIADIDRYGEDTLVTLKRGAFSLHDFLEWYKHREYVIRLDVASPQAFFVSIEEIVWHMVRDRLLVRRAMQRNLQNRESVKAQKKWWEEKIVYASVKSSLADSIALGDSVLHAYYQEHLRHFRSDSNTVVPFERARDDVRKEVVEYELTARMLHRINAMKRMYPVEINEDVLRALPVATENNPKAIDVYTVKKGGVFPHPAFPTIDYDWQTWE